MPTLRILPIMVCAWLLTSCAAPINKYNADRYYELGRENELSGNYGAAREAFNRAFINADLAGAPPNYMSAILYNLGRMYGYTCDYESAEQILQEALASEISLDVPDPVNIAKRLSELARLSFDMEKYEQSSDYYSEAIPILEQLSIQQSDPIGYAYYLEAYSSVLSALGRTEPSVENMKRAARLRIENAGASPGFVPIEYHDVCNLESVP